MIVRWRHAHYVQYRGTKSKLYAQFARLASGRQFPAQRYAAGLVLHLHACNSASNTSTAFDAGRKKTQLRWFCTDLHLVVMRTAERHLELYTSRSILTANTEVRCRSESTERRSLRSFQSYPWIRRGPHCSPLLCSKKMTCAQAARCALASTHPPTGSACNIFSSAYQMREEDNFACALHSDARRCPASSCQVMGRRLPTDCTGRYSILVWM